MREPISLGATVVADPDQVSADLEDEAVVLSLRNGVYYGLNPVGTRIWELLQQPRRVSEIRNVILEEYEVGEEQCESDLLSLLQQLSAEGLVRVSHVSHETTSDVSPPPSE